MVNNSQAAYDDALKAACRNLAYPLGNGKHKTVRVSHNAHRRRGHLADISSPAAAAFEFAFGGGRNKVSPQTASRDSFLTPDWTTKRLLRQSLAERDLVVKRAVYDMGIPEVHTGLMAQTTDSAGDTVLMIEVRTVCSNTCMRPCCLPAFRSTTGSAGTCAGRLWRSVMAKHSRQGPT